MKAVVYRCYGSPEVVKVEDLAKPAPGDDLAGTVAAVGRNVTKFRPGDEVWGATRGALAEYVSVAESGNLMPKPSRLTFEQAAAIPVAAVTALQAVRDEGGLRAGQKVLINGASGGVGTYAVQIAKTLGAEVTGVCSTRNVDLVGSLGADHVIDYTQQDFTAGLRRYDLVVDNVGNHSFGEIRRVLQPERRYVIVGGNNEGRWLGALTTPLKALLMAPFVSQKPVFIMAQLERRKPRHAAGTRRGRAGDAGHRPPVSAQRGGGRDRLPGTGARARGKVVVTVQP